MRTVPATTDTKSAQPADGWALVRAAQAGNPAAFADLYTLYRAPVRRLLGRLVWDQGLAEDLTSETFLRAWARIDSLAESTRPDPSAWLFRIARNLVIDYVRSPLQRRESVAAEIPEPRCGDPDDGGAAVSAAHDRAAAAVTVARLLEELSPQQRRAVLYYDLTPGCSTGAEAAAAMGASATTVRTLRHKALRNMRALLLAEGFTSSWACCDATTVETRCSA